MWRAYRPYGARKSKINTVSASRYDARNIVLGIRSRDISKYALLTRADSEPSYTLHYSLCIVIVVDLESDFDVC